jgi:uncharacterized RDD family membrane protein YckC
MAATVDLLFLGIPSGFVGVCVLAATFQLMFAAGVAVPVSSIEELAVWAVASWVLPTVIVEGFLTARYGRTPGKRWVALRVTDKAGDKPSYRVAFLRSALKHLPGWSAAVLWWPLLLVFAVLQIALLWRTGSAIHDLVSKTVNRPTQS